MAVFREIILRERTGRVKDKEDRRWDKKRKLGTTGLPKPNFMPHKIMEKYRTLYSISRGEMGQSQQKPSYNGRKSSRN